MKKVVYVIAIFIFIMTSICILPNLVEAASLIVPSSKTLTVGETQSITIGSGVTGRVDISSSDSSVVSVSSSKLWIENGSASVSITAKKEGNATITVTANSLASSEDGTTVKGSKTCSVTVKAKEIPKTETPKTETPKTTTTTQTTKKPTTTTTTKKTETKKIQIVETKEKEEATPELGIYSLKLIGIKENGEELEVGLDKEFNIKTFDYSCSIASDVKTVRIEKEAYEYNDIVQISGLEEELKVGENNITLKLAKDGKEVSYHIIITKEAKKEEPQQEEVSEVVAEPQAKKDIIVSIPLIWFILLELIIVLVSVGITITVMLYLKHNPLKKENKGKSEEKEFKKI